MTGWFAPLGMLDLGMELLKLLAVVGGATVGGLVSGWLLRLVGRFGFRRTVPRPAVLLVQVLGAITLGLLVWLWVYGSGGWGPGGGGLWGLGSGQGTKADTKGKSVETPKERRPEEAAVKGQAGPEVLRIEMLGGQRVQAQRFYVLEGQTAPQTLVELRQAIDERQKRTPPLKGIEIVIYENSVAKDHPAVRELERWAREHDLAVTVSFPKREAP